MKLVNFLLRHPHAHECDGDAVNVFVKPNDPTSAQLYRLDDYLVDSAKGPIRRMVPRTQPRASADGR